MRIRLIVGGTGIVATSTPLGEFADTAVSKCLARALCGASFPAPEGGYLTVEIPLELSP